MAEGPSWLLHDPGFPQTRARPAPTPPVFCSRSQRGWQLRKWGPLRVLTLWGWSWLMGASLFLSAT